MMKFLLFIASVLLLSSCAGDTLLRRGQNSQVTFSQGFTYESGRVVALLPFANAGQSGFNYPVTERFAANLVWAGFTVIDRALLEQAAAKANIDISKTPTRSQLAELGKSLNVGAIVAGTCVYRGGSSTEGEEAIAMISARFLDTASGETLLHAITEPDGIMPVTRSLAAAIRNSLMNTLFYRANAAYDRKDYAAAIADYGTLIALEPSLVEAYRNRGAAYSKAGDNRSALADYNRAVELIESRRPYRTFGMLSARQPEIAELLINRGIVLLKSGKSESAVLDFKRALKEGGDPVAAHANLGYALFRMNEINNSLVEYGKAVKAAPKMAEIYYQRGVVLEEVNIRDAISDFSQAVRLDGRFAPALAARARANLKLGYKDDAVRDYTLAIELDPENPEYLTGRGSARFQAGDRDRAIEDYSRAIETTPAYSDAYLGRGRSYAAQGDAVRAGKDFEQVLRSGSPVSGAVYLETGLLKEKSGKYQEAVIDFSKAIEISGNDASGYSSRARSLERLGNYRNSILDFSRSLEIRRDNPQDLFNRGYSSLQSGGYRQAIDDFSRAASLDPGYAPVFSNRGFAYQNTGNYSQAIIDYSRALTLIPGNAESSYRRRYPDAQLNQIVEEYNPFFIYYNRGLSYLVSKAYRPAIEDFTKAIELAPKSAEAFVRRGMANQQIAQMERAFADYDHAIVLDDRLAEAYFGRGSWYEQSGTFNSAIRDYTRAIDIKPDFAQAYFSRGLLKMQMNLVESGISDIKAAAGMNLTQAKDYLMTRGADW